MKVYSLYKVSKGERLYLQRGKLGSTETGAFETRRKWITRIPAVAYRRKYPALKLFNLEILEVNN